MTKVVRVDKGLCASTNESAYIMAGHKHRLEKSGVPNLVMVEIQSDKYLEKDVVVRFQNECGRAG
jgi:mannose-1-phosphate guanylyltransferase / mannose-6-phosphate isomerase